MASFNSIEGESFSAESFQRMRELFEVLDELRKCFPNPSFDQVTERQNVAWALWAWLRFARSEFERIEKWAQASA